MHTVRGLLWTDFDLHIFARFSDFHLVTALKLCLQEPTLLSTSHHKAQYWVSYTSILLSPGSLCLIVNRLPSVPLCSVSLLAFIGFALFHL